MAQREAGRRRNEHLICFSPEADVVAAAAIGVVGVATLRHVKTRRELIVGGLPLLFAVHQLIEAFVWLGLRGDISSGLGDAARDVYVLISHVLLPAIVPIGFLLIEPLGPHRRRLIPFVALGLAVSGFFLWHVVQQPVTAAIHPHGIAYDVHAPYGYGVAIAYIIATCGPAILSSRRYLRWFGVVNLTAALLAAVAQKAAFASVWCLYAAIASVLIYEHFRRDRDTAI